MCCLAFGRLMLPNAPPTTHHSDSRAAWAQKRSHDPAPGSSRFREDDSLFPTVGQGYTQWHRRINAGQRGRCQAGGRPWRGKDVCWSATRLAHMRRTSNLARRVRLRIQCGDDAEEAHYLYCTGSQQTFPQLAGSSCGYPWAPTCSWRVGVLPRRNQRDCVCR